MAYSYFLRASVHRDFWRYAGAAAVACLVLLVYGAPLVAVAELGYPVVADRTDRFVLSTAAATAVVTLVVCLSMLCSTLVKQLMTKPPAPALAAVPVPPPTTAGPIPRKMRAQLRSIATGIPELPWCAAPGWGNIGGKVVHVAPRAGETPVATGELGPFFSTLLADYARWAKANAEKAERATGFAVPAWTLAHVELKNVSLTWVYAGVAYTMGMTVQLPDVWATPKKKKEADWRPWIAELYATLSSESREICAGEPKVADVKRRLIAHPFSLVVQGDVRACAVHGTVVRSAKTGKAIPAPGTHLTFLDYTARTPQFWRISGETARQIFDSGLGAAVIADAFARYPQK